MKYDEQTIQEIVELKQDGMSSRDIATLLGVSKSGVNDAYNRLKEQDLGFPKILFLDIETAPDVAAVFGRRKQNISQDAVIQEGGWIISAAWKWQSGKTVMSEVLTPSEASTQDDYMLCWMLYDILEEADAVVAHNGINFDIPVIKARLAKHGFAAMKKVKIIDTLKIARQLRFQSNKLDSLGVTLGCGRKQKHSGIQLWIDCMKGNQEALDEMQRYNEQDVVLLEQVYNKLKAYDSNPVNIAQYYNDSKQRCSVCGSEHLKETGNFVYTQISKFAELQCEDCGARSRTRQQLNTKEKRSNFLM